MKKKILICVHNYYALENLFSTISELDEKYDVTIFTTNNQLSNKDIKEIKKLKNKIFFINFYNKNNKRNILSIFKTHLQINYLKKKIDFKDFILCLSDSKFFIWQRIILDTLLSKKCVQVAISLDAVLLPLDRFKKLLDDEPIENVMNGVHKLREIKKKDLQIKSFNEKIFNVYYRYIDIFFDRIFLSNLFYGRTYKYGKKDFRFLENTFFDYKITFVKSSYIFWENFYKKKIFLVKLKSNCCCEKIKEKKKCLFISGNTWNSKKQIDLKLKNLFKIFENLNKDNLNFKEIDFKHHPEELNSNKFYINKKLNEQNKFKFNILDNKISIRNIACNYFLAVGMLSGALFYLKQNCKNLQVMSFKSLNEQYWGDNYFLKFLGEEINFYDDTQTIFLKEKNMYEKKMDIKKYDFKNLIEIILKKNNI